VNTIVTPPTFGKIKVKGSCTTTAGWTFSFAEATFQNRNGEAPIPPQILNHMNGELGKLDTSTTPNTIKEIVFDGFPAGTYEVQIKVTYRSGMFTTQTVLSPLSTVVIN
jgi:hypothetical protein